MYKNKLNILSIFLVLSVMTLMIGCDSTTTQAPTANAGESPQIDQVQSAHSGNTVYVDANASGSEDGSQANPYNEIQEGIDHASPGEVVKLLSDFTLSSQVTLNKSLTLSGNDNTIFASFAKTSNSNNSAIGIIGTNDVEVSDLTVDGADGTDLHGINVYQSTGVMVSDVSIKDNDHSGLVVNGSVVTAHNISTAGHGWHGINVDQGANVDEPGVLTVTGTSSHDENSPLPPSDFVDGTHVPDIFVDDASANVTIHDMNDQYLFALVDFRGGTAKVYTHAPSTKDDCKKYGWEEYTFDNQGQCIQFVNTGK